MRLSCLLLLTALSTTSGQSWGSYPLQIGNRWDYGELIGPGQWQLHYTARIIGDTLMPNGHTYSIERSTLLAPFNTRYLRQVDSVVLTYSSQGETVLYDFSVNDGDTVRVVYSWNDTITTIVNVVHLPVFGQTRRTWIYYTRSSGSSMYSFEYVSDGIGYTNSYGEGGWAESCFGAIINGQQYGILVSAPSNGLDVPSRFHLAQNFPNPFNPSTRIAFTVPKQCQVSVVIYDVLGREIVKLVEGEFSAGLHEVEWKPENISGGVYCCQMAAEGFLDTKKLVLLK